MIAAANLLPNIAAHLLPSGIRVPALAAVLLITAGCVSAPPVQTVPEAVQQVDAGLFGDEPRSAFTPWWEHLDDDVLDSLIAAGLHTSPSPQIALARLAQAEQELVLARSGRWPSLVGRGARQVRHFSGTDADLRSDLGSLDLQWDAGLWGKRQLEIQSAQGFREQRWFEHQAIALALSASIAETYYQIVEQRTQAALLAAQIQVSQELEALIEARFRLGQARVSELYQQREQTSGLEQRQLVNGTVMGVLERNLDVLVGEVPDAATRVDGREVPNAPDRLGLGTPEDLIRHRADIRAGYARLLQAAAQVGVRFTERLPSLRVTADLTSLTEKAASAEWLGYGLDLALPLFTGGALRSLEQRALQVLEEERQQYHALWLAALEEVTTRQWQYQQQQRVINTLLERRGHAQQALLAARTRYTLGDQNYLDVLTALRGLQETDRFLIAERGQLMTLWIRVIEAIGQPMCGDTAGCRNDWQL